MSLGSLLAQLDEGLTSLVGQWNAYSTGIVTLLVVLITYSVINRVEPDIHPMLLARQGNGSPVRQEGESPIYRANSAPHSMPLNSGLNVKEPGASKWAQGRDGDLRDIWRKAVAGTSEDDGPKGKGRILTVLGTEKVVEHKLDGITRQINLIGQHISSQGGSKVAIYLPNSVEFIATLFACGFYNLTAVLLPYDESEATIISMLRQSGADTVVTCPGAFPFDSVVKSYPALRQLVWVVDEGSKHLDWNEVPKGMGGKVNVSTWQDILSDHPQSAGAALPAEDHTTDAPDVIMFWKNDDDTVEEMVRFTQGNIISAVSAQLVALPVRERLSPADLFFPAAPLSSSYPLVLTLGAIYNNASVAFNSVTGAAGDLTLATRGIAPTVIVATPETLAKTHAETTGKVKSILASISHWVQTRSLVQDGVMPAASFLASYNRSLHPRIGATPGKLRLIYVAHPANKRNTPRLSELTLSDLRIFTGARVMYALSAAQCAGAVAQTQFHDYRVTGDGKGTHFGPPMSSTEILLRNTGSHKITDENYTGEMVVRGPAVVGGDAALGFVATIRDDNTFALL
ncbi:hypothetical protein GGS20DRAFT_587630 [Poronia punctata]|nr:hypothetical protein GGS20DRAFT_587630 [Poronia punctata]